ncbi:hypothetical protein BV133_1655 [Blastochloris viridis]|uniref:Polysaccharide chain length determinant N-terminal domain-containing protein n=1 Tax=Blastochloris viridis TaxID=1079 RepID=A0A182D1L3_BLAVI|nr:hypothetical protein BV133_1655 [Blastochloris viridis]
MPEATDENQLTLPNGSGPWLVAFAVLSKALKRNAWAIIAAGVAGGVLAGGVKAVYPGDFTATAQLLIDPRGLRVFSNDLNPGQFDANAAFGFLESQMGVITSESVLARVLREEAAAAGTPPPLRRDGREVELRPGQSPDGERRVDTKALDALRRSVTVHRADRSYVVDITARASTPQAAARRANDVVKAYIDEDAESRADAARRLTSHLTARLEALGQALRESEVKTQAFRLKNNLIGTRQSLVVEQKLTEAITALGAAQSRLARARARVEQLKSAALDTGALGVDSESQRLLLLRDRQTAALEELARLTAELGERHPALVGARNRANEISRRVAAELRSIRESAGADLSRAIAEQDGLARTVQTLSGEVARAQQAEIELRALEQQVEANRKVLESFETRSREAGEFGQIDSANLRVVSIARPPERGSAVAGAIRWGLFGAVMGVLAAVAVITLTTLFGTGRLMRLLPRAKPA